MTLIGHGIDLVEVSRIQQLLTMRQADFLAGIYTVYEQEASTKSPNREQYFAGRYAVKEAIAKALRTGFAQGATWIDIEVRNVESGAPNVVLSGRALEIADQLGIVQWSISISNTPRYVVASAIAIGK